MAASAVGHCEMEEQTNDNRHCVPHHKQLSLVGHGAGGQSTPKKREITRAMAENRVGTFGGYHLLVE
jgi:hypothetical protein